MNTYNAAPILVSGLLTFAAASFADAQQLSKTFDTDTANNTETASTYDATIPAGSEATAGGGVLDFAVTTGGVVTRTMTFAIPGGAFTPDGDTGQLRVTFSMGSEPGGGATGFGLVFGGHSFIFHPGLTGGQFRHIGGTNQDMGFTPAGGGVLHHWDVLVDTGTDTFTIEITDGQNPSNVFQTTRSIGAIGLAQIGFLATGDNTLTGRFDDLVVDGVAVPVELQSFTVD